MIPYQKVYNFKGVINLGANLFVGKTLFFTQINKSKAIKSM